MASNNRFSNLANPSNTQSPGTPTQRPAASGSASASNSTPDRPKPRKRKGHRGGKKKRARRKSFAAFDEDDGRDEAEEAAGEGFFNLPTANLSDASIDSEALLDHR